MARTPVPVTQHWTHHLPLMQQTVLLLALRGPDGLRKYHPSKYLLRFLRRCVLVSAYDGRVLATPGEPGGGSFTGPAYPCSLPTVDHAADWHRPMSAVVGNYIAALDEVPHHFQLHLLHAAEVVGYRHPSPYHADFWRGTYYRLVADMHLRPETPEELDLRLGDDPDAWAAREDPAVRE